MINDDRIRMSIRLPNELYRKFRDKAYSDWRTHNSAIEGLVELWVSGKVELPKKASKRQGVSNS